VLGAGWLKHKWVRPAEIYANWIGECRPATAIAGVASLHYGLLLEIEAVALAMRSTGTRHNSEKA
jgi:hypothetical protein